MGSLSPEAPPRVRSSLTAGARHPAPRPWALPNRPPPRAHLHEPVRLSSDLNDWPTPPTALPLFSIFFMISPHRDIGNPSSKNTRISARKKIPMRRLYRRRLIAKTDLIARPRLSRSHRCLALGLKPQFQRRWPHSVLPTPGAHGQSQLLALPSRASGRLPTNPSHRCHLQRQRLFPLEEGKPPPSTPWRIYQMGKILNVSSGKTRQRDASDSARRPRA